MGSGMRRGLHKSHLCGTGREEWASCWRRESGLTRGQRGSINTSFLFSMRQEMRKGVGQKSRITMSSDVAEMMRGEENGWRQEVENRDRGGGGEVAERRALFIRADTSEFVIHREKGISQVTTYLLAFTHICTHRDMMSTCVIVNGLAVEGKGNNYGSGAAEWSFRVNRLRLRYIFT